MSQFVTSFFSDEGGAVTVDWVVLCAAIVVIAGLWFGALADAATKLDKEAADRIASFATAPEP